MRAREIIREDMDDSLSVDKVVQLITSKCSSIVNCYQLSGKVLYRGMVGGINAPAFVYKEIRTDRKPVELSPIAQNIIHNELQSNGIETTRSNSAFCSGQLLLANDWGTPYIIFPLDGWSASWFDGISEEGYSFNYFQELWAEAKHGAPKGNMVHATDNYVTSLNAMFEDFPPRETSNPNILAKYLKKSPAEVMISGPGYYALRTVILKTSSGPEIFQKLEINL